MRCPKCGFYTFDQLESCKKCNTDLRPYKAPGVFAASSPPSASIATVPSSQAKPAQVGVPSGTPGRSPAYFKFIGWLFVIFSGLMIMSAAMGLVVHSAMQEMRSKMPPFPKEKLPGFLGIGFGIFEYFDFFCALQILLAIFVIYAGYKFLKRQAWARHALEIVSWLGLTWIVGFGIFWIIGWVSMTSQVPDSKAPPLMFKVMGPIMGVGITAFYAFLIFLVLRVLRRKDIKEYME